MRRHWRLDRVKRRTHVVADESAATMGVSSPASTTPASPEDQAVQKRRILAFLRTAVAPALARAVMENEPDALETNDGGATDGLR